MKYPKLFFNESMYDMTTKLENISDGKNGHRSDHRLEQQCLKFTSTKTSISLKSPDNAGDIPAIFPQVTP